MSRKPQKLIAGAAVLTIVLAGCAQTEEILNKVTADTVTVVVHEEFPNEEFAQLASAATGLNVEVVNAGSGDELSSKLVLTKDAPIADVFFGVNNFFASRLVTENAVEPVAGTLPAGAEQFAYDEENTLVPVTESAVCLNTDPAWFKEHNLAEPETYADLLKPEYKDLTVAIDPNGSSTGVAFLAGTVAEFGEDGYLKYWEQLRDNGARFEQGWSEAYNGHFTQGGENGTYPIVVSYASSPAWTLTEDGSETTTKALLNTCSTMVEYAGILKGTENTENAKAVVDYMLSDEFQNMVAETMYVYPVTAAGKVPEEWAKFAPVPQNRNDLAAEVVGENRETWLRAWDAAING